MENMLIWGLALLGASLLLLVAELFVPSGGLVGITAAGCAIGGVVCLFKVSPGWGISGLLAIVVLGPVVFAFALKVLPGTRTGRKMLFGESGEERSGLPDDPARLEREAALIGAEGVVVSALRPVGVVRLGEQRVDAISDQGVVQPGTRVRVIAVAGNEVRVRPV